MNRWFEMQFDLLIIKAAFPLTWLIGSAGGRARSAALQNLSHWRVEARKNEQEMWWHCSGLSFEVVGLSMQAGHSMINVGLH